jgi:hypothetical protein
VSTGRVGTFDRFETPTGVFEHATRNPDYRAEGTKNEFGIRGLGAKEMRIFDFGWHQAARSGQTAQKDNVHLSNHCQSKGMT